MSERPIILIDPMVNVTSIDYFLPSYLNAISLANSLFFLTCYFIFFSCFGIMLFIITKKRKISLKKNPKILFILVAIFVSIQCATLFVRIVFDSWSMDARALKEKDSQQLFSKGYFFSLKAVGALTTLLSTINYVFVFVILFHVQMVFWTSAQQLGALSTTLYERIKKVTSALFGVFAFFSLMAVLTATIAQLLNDTTVISSSTMAIILYSCFAVLCSAFLFDIILTLMSGFFILKGIHKNSSYFKSFKLLCSCKQSNPFLVTFGLMIGLILCVCGQLLATALVSAAGSSRGSGLKILLIFATLSLLLFHPMFVQTERALSQVQHYNYPPSISSIQDSIEKKEGTNSTCLSISPSVSSPTPILNELQV
ncbi:hypothetical protein C9374_000023 [Naegleria lovaniensis]|uniref:Transmembrane protein n=1 Tax=Naegleria lovaniensis TaxID=51637 RepID=A0AA88KNZ5_NAELO|nr:uncharacterized protein C9374_000023 [Naegleria lovaniensis]KAG2388584.1 hypothetical protein C9374_000023 [Naegleria lovaniensis]